MSVLCHAACLRLKLQQLCRLTPESHSGGNSRRYYGVLTDGFWRDPSWTPAKGNEGGVNTADEQGTSVMVARVVRIALADAAGGR